MSRENARPRPIRKRGARARLSFWLTICFAACLAFVGCGDDATPPPVASPDIDTIEYELFPTTRLLTGADLETIVAQGEDGTLRFSPAPAALADLTTGMVIVGGASSKTPKGLIRGVGDVIREGDSLTITSMVVPVQMAFRRLSVHSAHRVNDLGKATVEENGPAKPGPQPLDTNASQKKSVRWVLFDGDGDEATLEDQVRLEGELGGGFVFDARFEVNWDAVENLPDTVAKCLESIPGILIGKLPDCTPLALLPEAKATFDVGPDLSAHADLIGSASLSFEKELALLKLSLTPIPIGPIVLVPGVDVIATLGGSAGASFRTGFDADMSARVSLIASTKNGVSLTPPRLERSDVKARDTKLAIMAKGRLSLGARISLQAYGIIGPYAQINGFAELAADTSKEPCWAISAGLSANAGLLLTTPRLPILGYVTIFDLKTPTLDLFKSGALAEGTCGFGKDKPLPGSGPGEKEYGQPAFPTWSNVRTVPGEVLWARTGVLEADLAFTQLERTSDGRFLVAAKDAGLLRKVDPSGAETWARGLSTDEGRFAIGRVATLLDSTVVVAGKHAGAPAVVTVGQGGEAFFGSSLGFGEACSAGAITAVAALPRQGPEPLAVSDYVVSGPCLETGRAFVAILNTAGQPRAGTVLSLDAATSVTPRALSVVDGAVWWIGNAWYDGISHVSAVKMDRSLGVLFANRYAGSCENNRRLDATFARPAVLRSELLVVGSSGSGHEGLLLRLRPDGSVAVGSFPSYGPGASDIAPLQSIVELPTTGYVVSGTHRDTLAPAGSREQLPAPYLAWLDGGGSVLFARRLTLDGGTAPTSSPRIEITEDGGLVLAATRDGGDAQHDAWTLKAFAKDGTVVDDRVEVAPLAFKATACSVVAGAIAVTPQPITPVVGAFVVSN